MNLFKRITVFVYGIWLPVKRRLDKIPGLYSLSLIGIKGRGCVILGAGVVHGPERIELGDRVYIGEGFYLQAAGGLVIGSDTHIARNVVIFTRNHDIDSDKLPYGSGFVEKSVSIGRGVWIGMNVCITPGVRIGDGAVIGMGTTISKDVQAGAIVVGMGSRVIGRRNMDRYNFQLMEGGS